MTATELSAAAGHYASGLYTNSSGSNEYMENAP
jgi:hypothetical protein